MSEPTNKYTAEKKLSDILHDKDVNPHNLPYLLPVIKDNGEVKPYEGYYKILSLGSLERYDALKKWVINGHGAFISEDDYDNRLKILRDKQFHNFSGCILKADFFAQTFTGGAYFFAQTFTGGAYFYGATFTGDAYFYVAKFTGKADFRSATFTGKAKFVGATFTGKADFVGATFTGKADFVGATFTGEADFGGATFTGEADFAGATFTGEADFAGATFTGEADFRSATFTGKADFSSVDFQETVFFNAINTDNKSAPVHYSKSYFDFKYSKFKSSSVFDDTIFHNVPDFRYVQYRSSNFRFDKTEIKDVKDQNISNSTSDTFFELSYKYKALKELAIASNDFKSEVYLYGEELEAYFRGIRKLNWKAMKKLPMERHPLTKMCFLYIYWLISDYARSVVRPIETFIFVAFLSWLFSFMLASVNALDSHSFSFAIKVINPLLLKPEEYSICFDNISFSYQVLVIIFIILFKLSSAISLFLLGLGIRNMFKIKG
ncbi:MAG: pentapeptide repeat-containing protein [Methylacidiphilales bacterium]|nr:pentapeptide repeat-containing protein [Candidatus Methylacidiphilales bacterium]